MTTPDPTDRFGSFMRKYRNLIIAGVLGLILILGAISAFTDWFGDWLSLRRIMKWQTNINALQNDVNEINGNLANMRIENGIMGAEVNRLAENHNRAKDETNQARNATNGALENLNAVNGRDFNGTSLTEAERLRCQAFPDRPECKR